MVKQAMGTNKSPPDKHQELKLVGWYLIKIIIESFDLGLSKKIKKLNLHFEENSILTFGHFIAS